MELVSVLKLKVDNLDCLNEKTVLIFELIRGC